MGAGQGDEGESPSSDPVPNQESLGTMWLATSQNWGSSWGSPKLFDPFHGSWGRNPVLTGLDGSWLLPLYNESQKAAGHQYEHSVLLRKPPSAPILPLSEWSSIRFNRSSYLVQPSVIRLTPGEPALRVYYRDRRAEWIYTATSPDDGHSVSFCHPPSVWRTVPVGHDSCQ